MPKGPPPEPYRPFHDTVIALNWLLFGMHCLAVPHELFTRRIGSMGREYPGALTTAVGVLLAPTVAASLAPPTYGGVLLLPYFQILILLAVAHGVAKYARKEHVHRHYIGCPWVGRAGTRTGEFALGFVLAFVAFLACDTLGALHLMSLICSSVSQSRMAARDRRITDRMKDSAYEAEYYSNRLE